MSRLPPDPRHLSARTGAKGQPVAAAPRPVAGTPSGRREQLELPTPRRVQGGVATTELTVSARVGENAELFAQILALHVPAGSLVADVTYGLGAFWKKVPADTYRVLAAAHGTGESEDQLQFVGVAETTAGTLWRSTAQAQRTRSHCACPAQAIAFESGGAPPKRFAA